MRARSSACVACAFDALCMPRVACGGRACVAVRRREGGAGRVRCVCARAPGSESGAERARARRGARAWEGRVGFAFYMYNARALRCVGSGGSGVGSFPKKKKGEKKREKKPSTRRPHA